MERRNDLLWDAMNAVIAMRSWLMTVAENHAEMDSAVLDDLIARWREQEKADEIAERVGDELTSEFSVTAVAVGPNRFFVTVAEVVKEYEVELRDEDGAA